MSSSGAQASITLKEALFPKWKRTGHKLRELLQDSSPMPMALMPAHTCQPLLYHLVHVVPAVALNPGSGKAMGKGPEGPRCSRRARHTACFHLHTGSASYQQESAKGVSAQRHTQRYTEAAGRTSADKGRASEQHCLHRARPPFSILTHTQSRTTFTRLSQLGTDRNLSIRFQGHNAPSQARAAGMLWNLFTPLGT